SLVRAAAAQAGLAPTWRDTQPPCAPSVQPGVPAGDSVPPLEQPSVVHHFQSWCNYLYDASTLEILPQLVGIQPEGERVLTDRDFRPKHIGVEANLGLGIVKKNSTICGYLLQIEVRSHDKQHV